MSVYKVNFANNIIISCTLVNKPVKLDDKYFCEHVNGRPIYALIEANGEDESISIAHQILIEIAKKKDGTDYIA